MADIIDRLCSEDIDVEEVDAYLNLALTTIYNSTNHTQLRSQLEKLNYRDMDIKIKKVIIIHSISQNRDMRAFVTEERHPNRGVRPPLHRSKINPFFVGLLAVCDRYINGTIGEDKMLKETRELYDRISIIDNKR